MPKGKDEKMDKDIEERFKAMEKLIENQFIRQEKKIAELRAQLEMLKQQSGQSNTLRTG